jgi:DeoR/GlpR family transcriptional regulator of sugar metabolism
LSILAGSRRMQIVELLGRTEGGLVTVTGLSHRFGVSEMTIRRDLDWLANRDLLTRVHGGALAIRSMQEEKPFGDRLNEYNPQKKSIGWAAAQLVCDGDRLILDAGTTTRQVAIHLVCKKNITVITNNLPAAYELARCPESETILLGGNLKRGELCTVGPMVKAGLATLLADKLFLSAAGFSLDHGATDVDLREVEVKQAMIAAAESVILVADSSKWGRRELARVIPLQEIDYLVTDDAFPQQSIADLEALGIDVVTPSRLDSALAKAQR